MRPIALLIASACLAFAAAAGTHPLPLIPVPGQETQQVTPLIFDEAAYALLHGADQVTLGGFPIGGGRTVDLELRSVDIMAPGGKVVLASADGEREVEAPDLIILAGSVVGVPGSSAFLGLSPHGCNGILEIDGHRHIISPGPHGAGLPTVVFDLDALPEGAINWRDFSCGLDLLQHPPKPGAGKAGGGGAAALPCRIAQIAIETDYEYTQNAFGGNTEASAAYALTLLAADSEIYTKDINTRFEIPFLRIWADDTDMYTGPSSVDRLYQMQAHWSANMQNVDRTLTTMLTAVRGDTGGIAWLAVLCSKDWGYSLSDYIEGYFPYPLVDHSHQNWDLMVTAHELGHNFGAPHTHDLNPVIDGCGLGDCSQKNEGTIMSYCHTCQGGMSNISLTLHQRMIDEQIVPYMVNNKGCKLIHPDPGIFQHPQSKSVCERQMVTFSVIPLGDENPNYQWRKDGVEIDGATQISYTIASAAPEDEGSYDVIVSNLCAAITSNPATLSVTACAADLNGDCDLDLFDFLAFQTLFNAGDPLADIDGDGGFDLFDFLAYQNLFIAGCE
jgi:hypothetical protein